VNLVTSNLQPTTAEPMIIAIPASIRPCLLIHYLFLNLQEGNSEKCWTTGETVRRPFGVVVKFTTYLVQVEDIPEPAWPRFPHINADSIQLKVRDHDDAF
jgi:hypothetical protein